MKKKYIFIAVLLLILSLLFYFRNIIFAIIIHSENIDKHTLSVMLQGRINPVKEHVLIINNTSYKIPLPKGAAELDKNEYLIPSSSWKSYKYALEANQWDHFDQIGTLIRVKNKTEHEFNISIRPFTARYFVLKYSS